MITLQNVSKKFESYSNPSERFKEFFITKNNDEGFWAVKDVNLNIKKGQTIGILGPNGSGKSTLLQIIAGIISPTYGDVAINGRVSALLELGAGFNPEFTGEENVYLNASILGMSKSEVKAKFESIHKFSGIGDFIYRPVKTYSSGMFVRLAFATAINVDPDIVIIDEALAVGDVAFQQRCISKLKDLQREGKTILFVSHDTSAVKSLCTDAILMKDGSIVEIGAPDKIVNKYLELVYSDTLSDIDYNEDNKLKQQQHEDNISVVTTIPNIDNRFGNRDAEILGITLLNDDNNVIQAIYNEKRLRVKISVKYTATVNDPIIGVVLRDRLGNDITATNNYLENVKLDSAEQGEIHTVIFDIDIPKLLKGNYTLSPAIANGSLTNHDMCDWIENAYIFEVVNEETVYGMMRFPVSISYGKRGN